MSQAVQSLESEVKTELSEQMDPLFPEVEFDMTEEYDMYTSNIEHLAFKYSHFYGSLFESINNAVQYHLTEETQQSDVFEPLNDWIQTVIDQSQTQGNRTTKLYNLQESISELISEDGSCERLTFVVTINHKTTRFWIHSEEVTDPELQINLETTPTNPQKSSLQSYTDDVTDNFVYHTPYQNRPRPQWKRTLKYSITNTEDQTYVQIDRTTERVSYRPLERICKALGLSCPTRDEPIPQVKGSEF